MEAQLVIFYIEIYTNNKKKKNECQKFNRVYCINKKKKNTTAGEES